MIGRRTIAAVTFLMSLTILVACGSGPDLDEPPDIRYGEDVCERCMMIINEARYATTYVTADGQVRRFDDIGGMMAYHGEVAEDVAVFWVHDFDSEAWLKAEEATFVASESQQTPMGFGIVAFADRDRAEAWAADHMGELVIFPELVERYQ